MDRARGDRASVPALLDGLDGVEPGAPAHQSGPSAEQLPALVDRGHLRVLGRRDARYDGHARRQDRAAPFALDGAAAFGVASVLAAFSKSAGMLIAARAVLGIAGATLAP